MKTTTQLWTFDTTLRADKDAWIGYDVLATDGEIGKIDEMSHDAGRGSIVVDTGFWIFGKKRILPASAVRSVDTASRTVSVALTKDQIKNAPDFDQTRRRDDDYYDEFGAYYGPHL
jgi:hypothetical protein